MPEHKTEMTVIGRDARFKGELEFSGSARILGECEGSIRSGGVLEIGEGGRCHARVDAERIVVEGEAGGELIGRDRIELMPTARVRADISAGNLIVQDGASFVGHCSVGPEAVEKAEGSRRAVSAEVKGSRSVEREEERPAEPTPTIETRSVRPSSTPAKAEASASRGDLQSDWMRLAQGASESQKRTG